MSKVRDIINSIDGFECTGDHFSEFQRRLGDFHRTFDPEHVALMEAVVEAARMSVASVGDMQDSMSAVDMTIDTVQALDTYRREHGLV